MRIAIPLCCLSLLLVPLTPAGAQETVCHPPEPGHVLEEGTHALRADCTIGSVGGVDHGLLAGVCLLDYNPPQDGPADGPRPGEASCTVQANDIGTGACEVGFNPQPEPPGQPLPGGASCLATAPGLFTGLAAVAFNPQPEPPGRPGALVFASVPGVGFGYAEIGFNPQPEPPGHTIEGTYFVRAAGLSTGYCEVGFNPQPEPPGHECRSDIIDG